MQPFRIAVALALPAEGLGQCVISSANMDAREKWHCRRPKQQSNSRFLPSQSGSQTCNWFLLFSQTMATDPQQLQSRGRRLSVNLSWCTQATTYACTHAHAHMHTWHTHIHECSHMQWCAKKHTRAWTHARTHALTHSLTHSLTHALTHSRTHSLTHSQTHSSHLHQLNGAEG
jgi:hypothetical protein